MVKLELLHQLSYCSAPHCMMFPFIHGFFNGVSSKAILRAQLTPMILGGDHAITAPICGALAVLQTPVASWTGARCGARGGGWFMMEHPFQMGDLGVSPF